MRDLKEKFSVMGDWYPPPFCHPLGSLSDSFGLTMSILAGIRLAKIRTMARPTWPDMPPKPVKKVR